MTLDPNHIDQFDKMVERLNAFMLGLSPTTEEEGSFYHVVTAIGGDAVPNYWMAREAYFKDQQYRVAWACRNMLELAIFAEFVIASQNNMTLFAEDRLIDGYQIAQLLLTMEEWAGAEAAQSNVSPLVDEHLKMMDEEHITRRQFNRVEDIATGLLKKEFSTVNKLCSKFVHPTAWSLLTADRGPGRFPDASEILFTFAAKYFALVTAAFMPHIRQYGLRPKPPE